MYLEQDLHSRYPGTDESGLHLLQSMLRFDPRHRVSVDAALGHPYLAAVRNISKETVAPVPMSDRIESIGEDQDHLHANVRKNHPILFAFPQELLHYYDTLYYL